MCKEKVMTEIDGYLECKDYKNNMKIFMKIGLMEIKENKNEN